MESNNAPVSVVIFDLENCYLGASLDSDTATTLFAVASEDPNSWDDLVGYWPRYRTPVVAEFADGIAFKTTDRVSAMQAINASKAWLTIDLIKKRIVSGGEFCPIGRDQSFAMDIDEKGKHHYPLGVHLPPWWELFEQADASVIDQPRKESIQIPQVDREVLFGKAMLGDIASRVLKTTASEKWLNSEADSDENARYLFTVEVHRDWLMTPRDDLNGKMPRQLLHGARDWHDRLVSTQRRRFEDRCEVVAAPVDVAGFESAPMGSDEMAMYFELCRELISAGWNWCAQTKTARGSTPDLTCLPDLVTHLSEFQKIWLHNPFEGDSPPSFVFECSRRRVPQVSGVPIVGLAVPKNDEHAIDCDCPICLMMAEGVFGPCLVCFDGHRLEIDGEFAFSMYETKEEWEAEQYYFEAIGIGDQRKN